jgi:MYXO-CTERM domain-containing protein
VQLYRNMGVNSAFADELRVGTTWADVTPPVPEPALLLGLLALLPLLRRR